MNKLDIIFNWITAGYTVYADGSQHNRLYKTLAGNIGFEHFGSGAQKLSKENLKWMLDVIFDDVTDFYIINRDGLMEHTNAETAFYCNTAINDFEFFNAYGGEKPLMKYADTITHFIQIMPDLAKELYKRENCQVACFEVKRCYKNQSNFNQFRVHA